MHLRACSTSISRPEIASSPCRRAALKETGIKRGVDHIEDGRIGGVKFKARSQMGGESRMAAHTQRSGIDEQSGPRKSGLLGDRYR